VNDNNEEKLVTVIMINIKLITVNFILILMYCLNDKFVTQK